MRRMIDGMLEPFRQLQLQLEYEQQQEQLQQDLQQQLGELQRRHEQQMVELPPEGGPVGVGSPPPQRPFRHLKSGGEW